MSARSSTGPTQPLATAEVAAIRSTSVEDARAELGAVADEQHIGFEGIWHLNGAAA